MLCVHCIAHRLVLCCADSAIDMDYPDEAETVVNNISSFFNRSGKRRGHSVNTEVPLRTNSAGD